MIQLSLETNRLIVEVPVTLAPRHLSQLSFWGFSHVAQRSLQLHSSDSSAVLARLAAYFDDQGLEFELSPEARAALAARDRARERLATAQDLAGRFKNAATPPPQAAEFLEFLDRHVPRRLRGHQVKAALHLLAARHGANFSVPGSGKTSVVLAVYDFLRRMGEIQGLFVVGPPAIFQPWRTEFAVTLGREPDCTQLAGGNPEARRLAYLVTRETAPELFLTTFQTLQRDLSEVRMLLQHQGLRFFLVLDEAHYVKRLDGVWATTVLELAAAASRRCVLTGTPFPHSLTDAFNLFDFLWPESPPISTRDRDTIELATTNGETDTALAALRNSIGPLFYRVRKPDLGLAPQNFLPPVVVPMNRHERFAYDTIREAIEYKTKREYFRDLETALALRRGRMIRLRQCLSFAGLLSTAVEAYDEDLLSREPSLAEILQHYLDIERPAKLEHLLSLVGTLTENGHRVVVWSNFVRTLELIRDALADSGFSVGLIYGATPVEAADAGTELTREAIISRFTDPHGPLQVLVANPAACAESISLHKTCSHAIYYDISYNCAQYLQSLDRIHRVGGSEETEANYHFLQYADTIDADILANVRQKADRMASIIDTDYPVYSLDMFSDDDELEAYGRLFNA